VQIGSLLRSLGYAALALVTLELAARIDDLVKEGAPLLKPYTINTLFRPSPFGREGVPSARFGKWQMNALGYRGPELRDGRANIVTFGASETFGLYESLNKEYPRALEARLEEARPQAHSVVNIAIPGIRIGRIGYLERAMERTQARYVVVYPSPANYIGTAVPFCRQASTPVASSTGVADRVRLSGKLDQLAKKVISPQVLSPVRSLMIRWANRKEAPVERVPEETLNALREDLQCVVRAAQRRNAIPILVTHATYFGDKVAAEDAAMLLAWRRFYPELLEDGFLDLEKRANDVIRAVAADNKLPLVDAAAAIHRGPAHFADFVHFTDKGAATMAGLIADVILKTPPLPASAAGAGAPAPSSTNDPPIQRQ
jgi:lysophospholipase L1-like esterase